MKKASLLLITLCMLFVACEKESYNFAMKYPITGNYTKLDVSGAFDVVVDDGESQKTFSLNRSYYGLYVPAGLWRTMKNFSTNSLALVLSSTKYDAADYIRDYNEFLEFARR